MTKENSDPIEYILERCVRGKIFDKFVISNARDQLKRFKESGEYFQIGWARINDRGDIYDLRKHKPMADNLVELYIKS
jgi:hypothetical protein